MTDHTGTTTTDVWAATAVERRRLADELDTLTDEQWRTRSQCERWTVHDVAVHLLVPYEVSLPRFGLAMLRRRGNFDEAMIDLTERVKSRVSRDDISRILRENADNEWTPPGAGPEIPFSDVVVHSQDIRQVLGMKCPIPQATINLALNGIEDDAQRADYARRIGQG